MSTTQAEQNLTEFSQELEKLLSIEGDENNSSIQTLGTNLKPEANVIPTKHSLVTSPWSRLLLIGICFGFGFLSIWMFLNSVFHSKSKIKIVKDSGSATDLASKADRPEGDIYARLALAKQEQELDKLKPASTPNPTKLRTIPNAKKPLHISSAPAVEPHPTRQLQVPPPVQYRPLPVVTPPVIPRVTALSTGGLSVKPVDPGVEFTRLRSVGSFGTLAYVSQMSTPVVQPSPIPTNTVTSPQGQTSNSVTSTSVVPLTPRSSQSQTPNSSIEKLTPLWAPISNTTAVAINNNSYSPQEQQIINGASSSRYLMPGETASGVLMTPIVKSENSGQSGQNQTTPNQSFLAQLTQDLRDNLGNVAIPSGTLMVLKITSVQASSYAQVEVMSILKDGTEYQLNPGSITVQGDKGGPLIAKKYQDKGGALASLDTTSAALAGVSQVGQILNQATTQATTQIAGGVSSVTSVSTSPPPNLFGAFLQGAFGQASKLVGQRADTETQEILKRPNVWFIPKGTKITFVVNNTLQVP